LLPSADENLIQRVEQTIAQTPPSTEMIRQGYSPEAMLRAALGDLGLDVLGRREPSFYCQCSRERVLQIISALGRQEVEDMLAKDNGAELICHFCNEAYQVTGDELTGLLAAD
jgi:molecular chaperone Hsp33